MRFWETHQFRTRFKVSLGRSCRGSLLSAKRIKAPRRTSLSTVACSDGANGLLTKNFTTFGSLPSFPNIGAAQAVGGWNSPACGSCWTISFGGKSINVIAVDHAGDGFNLSLEAMNTLTNGHAQELGVINAQATQVDPSQCGL
ncbi:immunomodulatory protein [Lactarius deliciosus]|nr:immunomodulatory protein [Lactarius deliciosus]KAH9057041.1 immunomodulatory protein [Lactarius deliciosus]